jgi:hypothetical protein
LVFVGGVAWDSASLEHLVHDPGRALRGCRFRADWTKAAVDVQITHNPPSPVQSHLDAVVRSRTLGRFPPLIPRTASGHRQSSGQGPRTGQLPRTERGCRRRMPKPGRQGRGPGKTASESVGILCGSGPENERSPHVQRDRGPSRPPGDRHHASGVIGRLKKRPHPIAQVGSAVPERHGLPADRRGPSPPPPPSLVAIVSRRPGREEFVLSGSHNGAQRASVRNHDPRFVVSPIHAFVAPPSVSESSALGAMEGV